MVQFVNWIATSFQLPKCLSVLLVQSSGSTRLFEKLKTSRKPSTIWLWATEFLCLMLCVFLGLFDHIHVILTLNMSASACKKKFPRISNSCGRSKMYLLDHFMDLV